MLIGREQEFRLLGEWIGQRKNILVLGPEGVGKSAILEHLLAAGTLKRALYSKRSTTLKETLANIAEFALGSKNLRQENISSLKKMCYGILAASPQYAVLDHLVWVEPKFYGFLTYLKEREITFITATRAPNKKEIGHLWMGLYDFEKLEIKNLDQTGTSQWIDSCAESFDLKLHDAANFKKEAFTISRGNPKIIKELCRLAGDEKYYAKGSWDLKLMDLDRRIKNATA